MLKRIIIGFVCILAGSGVLSAEEQNLRILYPKDNSVVGNKVNMVIEPADIPYFQIIVNKKEYPRVDTSTGTHAYQGLTLDPGVNVITVNALAPDDKDSQKLISAATGSVRVFNRDGVFSPFPADFSQESFHTRERESSCAGCHRLEAGEQDWKHARPEDVLCYSCHREVPKGKHIHGPAAVWNCLSCHDPELYTAKYAFSSVDPWKIIKSTRPVEPIVYTFSAANLFRPKSALLISKEKTREVLADIIEYMKQNPGEKLRLEVHTDNVPLKQKKNKKGKLIGYKSNLALSSARARTLSTVLKESGIPTKRMVAVGMGEKLPKAANITPESREINNRVEVVVYPRDVKVVNSRKLPVLKDRVRVIINAIYSQGPLIKKVRFVERVPKGMQYVKGSGFFGGRQVEPKISGSDLRWDLGDIDSSFSENIFYVVKKGKGAAEVPVATKILYRARNREFSREFDPKASSRPGSTVMETCFKCHQNIARKKFRHGPADAGYCNLCHDPHASPNPAWLRRPAWNLCTTCHADKGSGVHVVAGFVTGITHPTKGRRDPARPGKRFSCTSCHEPHGGETPDLFAYEAKTRTELCGLCHRK